MNNSKIAVTIEVIPARISTIVLSVSSLLEGFFAQTSEALAQRDIHLLLSIAARLSCRIWEQLRPLLSARAAIQAGSETFFADGSCVGQCAVCYGVDLND